MAEITNQLLKQAIADAEAVRQTAIANAKIALEETFTPTIKSMLARRLRAEAAEEDEGKMEETAAPEKAFQDATAEPGSKGPEDTSGIGTGDNKTPSADSTDSSDIDQGGEGHKDSTEGWYDDWNASEFDLDEVIKELEEDVNALSEGEVGTEGGPEDPDDDEEEEKKKKMPPQFKKKHDGEEDEEGEEDAEGEEDEGMDPAAAQQMTKKMQKHGDDMPHASASNPRKWADASAKMSEEEEEDEGMGHNHEEELDLESVLRELEAEDEARKAHSSKMASHIEELQKELAEYRSAVMKLRGHLSEVNLLNAKLLYTNRIFRQEGLTNEQKVAILENFDRAMNVREVKMVYTTLVETLTIAAKSFKSRNISSAKVVTEGLASKPTQSTAPKAQILEENAVATRLKQLAGIL